MSIRYLSSLYHIPIYLLCGFYSFLVCSEHKSKKAYSFVASLNKKKNEFLQLSGTVLPDAKTFPQMLDKISMIKSQNSSMIKSQNSSIRKRVKILSEINTILSKKGFDVSEFMKENHSLLSLFWDTKGKNLFVQGAFNWIVDNSKHFNFVQKFFNWTVGNNKNDNIFNKELSNKKSIINNLILYSKNKDHLLHPEIIFLIKNKADINLKNELTGDTLVHMYFKNDRNYTTQRDSVINWDLFNDKNFKIGCPYQEIYPVRFWLTLAERRSGIEFSDLKEKIGFKKYVIFNDLKFFIEHNADLSIKNNNGDTSLHITGSYRGIRAFSNLKFNDLYDLFNKNKLIKVLNIQNNKGVTPFMYLVQNPIFDLSKNLEILKFHLYNDEKKLIVNKKNANILHYIAKKKLYSPYGYAVDLNDIYLLNGKYSEAFWAPNSYKKSALELVCATRPCSDHENIAKILGLNKEDIFNMTDNKGNNYLHNNINSLNGHLIEKNEQFIFQKNSAGDTPLHKMFNNTSIDSLYEKIDISHWLDNNQFIKENIKKDMLNIQNSKGNTVFYTIIKNYQGSGPERILVCLEKDPDLTIKNRKGNTPIHKLLKWYCKKNDNFENLKNFNLTNEQLQMKNNKGKTPWMSVLDKYHHLSEKNIAKRFLFKIGRNKTIEQHIQTLKKKESILDKATDFKIIEDLLNIDYYFKEKEKIVDNILNQKIEVNKPSKEDIEPTKEDIEPIKTRIDQFTKEGLEKNLTQVNIIGEVISYVERFRIKHLIKIIRKSKKKEIVTSLCVFKKLNKENKENKNLVPKPLQKKIIDYYCSYQCFTSNILIDSLYAIIKDLNENKSVTSANYYKIYNALKQLESYNYLLYYILIGIND